MGILSHPDDRINFSRKWNPRPSARPGPIELCSKLRSKLGSGGRAGELLYSGLFRILLVSVFLLIFPTCLLEPRRAKMPAENRRVHARVFFESMRLNAMGRPVFSSRLQKETPHVPFYLVLTDPDELPLIASQIITISGKSSLKYKKVRFRWTKKGWKAGVDFLKGNRVMFPVLILAPVVTGSAGLFVDSITNLFVLSANFVTATTRVFARKQLVVVEYFRFTYDGRNRLHRLEHFIPQNNLRPRLISISRYFYRRRSKRPYRTEIRDVLKRRKSILKRK